jgi:hypothetical protein
MEQKLKYIIIVLPFSIITHFQSFCHAYPSNPAYDCVCNPLHEYAYDKQPNTIQAFGLRLKSDQTLTFMI